MPFSIIQNRQKTIFSLIEFPNNFIKKKKLNIHAINALLNSIKTQIKFYLRDQRLYKTFITKCTVVERHLL